MRFLLFSLILLTTAASANVYKWTDATGRVHFSDKPPATAAEKLDIETQRTDPEQLSARLTDEPAQQAQPGTIVADESQQDEFEREQNIRRDENCARARDALASLLSATRIYEPLPDGGRRYLEEDEVDQRMTDARRDVDEWCGSSE
ncbi:MAG: DUF4124 domain-containing protein [Gammaproteobacteria bacterium]|nr:DUF4124 domain-containing protein [Gammaproteobacteria bacterium]NNF60203.1 DUF4124 domain-containing protein [Gammaproteobacteria bacterium]NNM21616.1 DUF4124 domain-containing protein [Gammaproteobacteria bacterium]